MNKFYSFQEKMGIVNQHCFHNCKYLKEKLKEYNINVKSVNGFLINTRNGLIRKLEHNWLEIDGEIIEPNKELYDEKNKFYFSFNEKEKMYKQFSCSYKEKIEDLIYQKQHLEKYCRNLKNFNKYRHIKYIEMLWSRTIDVDLCNEIKDFLKIYNIFE